VDVRSVVDNLDHAPHEIEHEIERFRLSFT